jgi:hypothetical protein
VSLHLRVHTWNYNWAPLAAIAVPNPSCTPGFGRAIAYLTSEEIIVSGHEVEFNSQACKPGYMRGTHLHVLHSIPDLPANDQPVGSIFTDNTNLGPHHSYGTVDTVFLVEFLLFFSIRLTPDFHVILLFQDISIIDVL